ncbi:MAG: hypothetical protein ABI564_12095 [Ideonella sp.]
MSGPLRPPLSRSALRLMVWCLLFAIPLYGFTGSLVQLLGNEHVHRSDFTSVVSANAAIPTPGSGDFRALEDFRRLASGQGHAEHAPGHSHDGFQRHHHDAADTSVIALDGGASPDEGGGAAAPHLLAFTAPVSFALPPLPPFRWPAALQSAVAPWIADSMERPPKA